MGGIRDVDDGLDIEGYLKSYVRSMVRNNNETNLNIEDLNDDKGNPTVYMNQRSLSDIAERIFPALKTASFRKDHTLSDITQPSVGKWANMLLNARAGDEDFMHGVPVEGVTTPSPTLFSLGVPTSEKIELAGNVQADVTSTSILQILPTNENYKSDDFHLELPESSVKNQEWNEKSSLQWEYTGLRIFKKLKETCVLALEFIEVNKNQKDSILNNLMRIEPYPDYIHDEVDIVQQNLLQDSNIRINIDQLLSSLQGMSSEAAESRYNRIQFLASVFSEYDKQHKLYRKPLLNTPIKEYCSTQTEPPTPPKSEGDRIFEPAFPNSQCVPELTSELASPIILEEKQSTEVQILTEPDENIAQHKIPPGLRNNEFTTCYINAGLQLLSSVPEFSRCVEQGVKFWEESGTKDLGASKAFLAFIEERNSVMRKPLHVRNLEGSFAPAEVTNFMFQRYPKRFKRNTQQDCMEFVTSLLEAIHEECGEECSPVSKLFMGVQRRFLRKDPPSAASEEVDVTDSTKSQDPEREEFSSVTIHFTSQHINIEDGFNFYTSKQYSSEGKSHHWCLFEKLPRLLLVHVLAFNESEQGPKKALIKVGLRDTLRFRKEWMYQAEAAEAEAAEAEAAEAEAAEAEAPEADFAEIVAAVKKDDAEARMFLAKADGSYLERMSISSGTYSITDDELGIECDKSVEDSVVDKLNECTALFELRAVVLHSGLNTTFGHYTAGVSAPDSSGERVWYRCNDEIVQRMTSLQALEDFEHSAEVTCLLYERVENCTM